MKKVFRGILNIGYILAIFSLIIAILSFWYQLADTKDAASSQSTRIAILTQQLGNQENMATVQAKMATMQASGRDSGINATVIAKELVKLEQTKEALTTMSAQLEKTEISTVEPTTTLTYVDVKLCTRAELVNRMCSSTQDIFPGNTEAVYATWQMEDALDKRTKFIRRWYKDGSLLFTRSNFAGENDRWTPHDGRTYYVYISAVEGTGKSLFESRYLPSGNYEMELFVDGNLANTAKFTIKQ